MVKINMLKAKIYELETTYDDCALSMGIAKNTFYYKMIHQNFTAKQASALANFLKLNLEERANIFLS